MLPSLPPSLLLLLLAALLLLLTFLLRHACMHPYISLLCLARCFFRRGCCLGIEPNCVFRMYRIPCPEFHVHVFFLSYRERERERMREEEHLPRQLLVVLCWMLASSHGPTCRHQPTHLTCLGIVQYLLPLRLNPCRALTLNHGDITSRRSLFSPFPPYFLGRGENKVENLAAPLSVLVCMHREANNKTKNATLYCIGPSSSPIDQFSSFIHLRYTV